MQFLLHFPLDKMRQSWYNGKYGAQGPCTRRQIKMSQYPNWLHSPTHFREHSVALLSRPNVHDLWRVRFRNFLSCGFYLGGLLISFTPFLCFNYNTSLLLCQHFFEIFFQWWLLHIVIINPNFVFFEIDD